MKPAIAVLLPLLLTACYTISEPHLPGHELEWDQYLAIEPGAKADDIREAYGQPNEIRRDVRGTNRYTYYCWDEKGEAMRTVDLHFDLNDVLVEKSVR